MLPVETERRERRLGDEHARLTVGEREQLARLVLRQKTQVCNAEDTLLAESRRELCARLGHSNFERNEGVSQGVKFIVLDEVDYMTKNAQLALKYLLQEYQEGIRFCLICNYISKIDESLQTEFVRLRFNQLPKAEIIRFLDVINTNERLGLTHDHLESIQNNYKSDIRSMINYMQSNQSSLHAAEVINNEVYDRITALLQPEKKTSFKEFSNYMHHISQTYNIDIKSIIKDYFNYLIRHKPESITEKLLTLMETVTHNTETNMDFMLHYIIKGGPPPFKTPGVAFW